MAFATLFVECAAFGAGPSGNNGEEQLPKKTTIARANHSLPPPSLAMLDLWRKLKGHTEVKSVLNGLSGKVVGGVK
ncbi:hypothetical protein [Roseibium sp. RKSG952]|uniref:hypothetical protein n=1 Tax=Roseibium sp. RKSG952 TaxID=2529384 RepID=UPI0012BD5B00|nr:hypothetical protein [Roseibium sp. RKSG952]